MQEEKRVLALCTSALVKWNITLLCAHLLRKEGGRVFQFAPRHSVRRKKWGLVKRRGGDEMAISIPFPHLAGFWA